jgi:quercetin dioxygenase-like cupin family protein
MIEFELVLRNLFRKEKIMPVTRVVKANERTILDLLGPKIEPLTLPEEGSYCVVKGTIPQGFAVPLHSHGDAESFYVLSGEAQFLMETARGLEWQTLRPGDFVHITGAAKHAWCNVSHQPMEALITCTAKLGRALRELAQPKNEGGRQAATKEDIQRLAEISARYGYWLGSPEENAEVGISLF